MPQEEVGVTLSALFWPHPDHTTSKKLRSSRRWTVQHNARRYLRDPSQEPGEANKSVADTGSNSAMDLRGHGIPSLASTFSTIDGTGCERATVSLDLERQRTLPEQVRYSEEIGPVSIARLRGGADQHQTSLFNRLRRSEGLIRKLDEGGGRKTRTAVTYKGKEIGSPQPMSTLGVLPPASRFVRRPVDRIPLHITPKSPLNNDYDINGNHLPTLTRHNYHTIAHPKSPSLPPQPTLLATLSRPATSNPFAGIYGNPNVVRAGSTLHTGNLLQTPKEFPDDNGNFQDPAGRPIARKVQIERKWDSLPALPPEGAPTPPPKDGKYDDVRADDVDSFDTEELLNSLRPERLSLYHINTPGHTLHSSIGTGRETTVIAPHSTHAIAFGTVRPTNSDSSTKADNHSIRTREWDLQSCATDDLGLDSLLKQREQLAKCNNTRRWIPEEQQRQNNKGSSEDPLNGLPGNDPSTAESTFYAELTDIMKKYHHQRGMLQRAFDAGEVSEKHWRRELWRHGTAMDQMVRAAAAMSNYKVLTDEHEIREAINSATGYAIYYELLSTRDPEKWHRILNPYPTNQHHHTAVPENSLLWLARKAGRAVRFMLAVPEDPNLKTYSSRHPPSTPAVTYKSNVAVLGPNIPSRSEGHSKARASMPSPTLLRQNSASARRPEEKIDSRTPLVVPATDSTESTKVIANTAFTGTTLACPLNGPHALSPRSRGYEQSTFVTVLNPSHVSPAAGNMVSRYGAGKLGKKGKGEAGDEESKVTTWPEAEC